MIEEHCNFCKHKVLTWFMKPYLRCALMERLSKLKLPMVLLPVITVFTRKEVKPVRTALLQSLRGQEDLHTGMTVSYSSSTALGGVSSGFIHNLGLQILHILQLLL